MVQNALAGIFMGILNEYWVGRTVAPFLWGIAITLNHLMLQPQRVAARAVATHYITAVVVSLLSSVLTGTVMEVVGWAGVRLSVVLIHMGLAVLVFLIVLNGYLQGAWKGTMDAALSVSWLMLLGVGVLALGWRVGASGLVLSFAYAAMAKPFAATLAYRLLGWRPSDGAQ